MTLTAAVGRSKHLFSSAMASIFFLKSFSTHLGVHVMVRVQDSQEILYDDTDFTVKGFLFFKNLHIDKDSLNVSARSFNSSFIRIFILNRRIKNIRL